MSRGITVSDAAQLRGRGRAVVRLVQMVLAVVVGLCVSSGAAHAAGPFPITESFDSTSWGQFEHGGSARLTADEVRGPWGETPDPVGDGWLRFNETSGALGYIYSDTSFPSTQGWVVEFEYAMWGSQYSTPSDGITLFLFDAAVPFRLGPGGGGIGYACDCFSADEPGLAGGYAAVGLDIYGNFSRSRNSPFIRSQVAIRGPESLGYPLLAAQPIEDGLLTQATASDRYNPVNGRAKATRVRISYTADRRMTVEMRRPGSAWDTVIAGQSIPGVAPERLKVGFAGGSGSYDLHNEIRRFSTTQALDYAVTSVDDGASTGRRGETRTWAVKVKNQGSSTASTPPQLKLESEEGLDGVSWSCQTGAGQACGSGTGLTATPDAAIPAGETYTFSVKGKPSATAARAQLTATVKNTDPGVSDVDPANDSASDTTELTSSAPVASAGPDQSVTEGDVVTLDASGSSDPDGDALTYSWKRVSGTGPTPVLTSTTGERPQFEALDDGSWTFRVTVDDQSGAPATDEVTVSAKNKAPTVQTADLAGQAGGASVLSATIGDVGVLDRQTAKVIWGDGTTTASAAVTNGAGWATVVAAHRYATPGDYRPKLEVTDDDGGVATKELSATPVSRPGAIWADARTDPFLGHAFSWLGAGGKLTGTLHSNASVNIAGLGNAIDGATEYSKNYLALGLGLSVPSPKKVPASAPPAALPIADFRPGGPVAAELGSKYRDMTSSCRYGVWGLLTPGELEPGVYYAPCDVHLSGLGAKGKITIVATGGVHFLGAGSDFTPYYRGVLALAGRTSGDSIRVTGNDTRLAGQLDGRGGAVRLTGARLRLTCGLVGETVSITGVDVRVTGGDCAPPAGTVATTRVVPEIQTALAVDRDDATPGDTLRYSASVTNSGAGLFVTGIAGVENSGTSSARVDGITYDLQYRGTDKQWRTVSSSQQSEGAAKLATDPMPSPGVVYGSGGPTGTTIAAGGLATWGYQARVSLRPEDAALLYDPARALAVRSVVRLTTSGDARTRELNPDGEDITTALRSSSPDVQNARIVVAPPTGDVRTFTATDTPALARLTPGTTGTVQLPSVLPVPVARGEQEAVSSYLKRLRAANGAQVRGSAYTRAFGGGVALFAPLQRAATEQHLPVVNLELTGPTALQTGASGPFKFSLVNQGSAPAKALTLTGSATGGATTTLGPVPTELVPSAIADVSATLQAPSDGGTVRQTGRLGWKDANGNTYGVVESSRSTTIRTPAALKVTKTASLDEDRDENGRVSVGDVLAYEVVAENTGASPLTGSRIVDPLSAMADAVTGSVTTTQGTASILADSPASAQRVEADLGTVAGGDQAKLRFKVRLKPLAKPTTRPVTLENQAVVTSDQLQPLRSDDPATPLLDDPTLTAVYSSSPSLTLTQNAQRIVDADSNDADSPGDTLRYRFALINGGDRAATGVAFRSPAGAFLTLVPGSLTTEAGTPAIVGGAATVSIPRLEPQRRVTIVVDAKIDAVLPDNVDRVSTGGSVASNEQGVSAQSGPVVTELAVEPRLTVTKTAELTADRDGNGAVSRGDTLSYRVVVRNASGILANGVSVTDTLDGSTDLVAGTLRISQGSVSAAARTITGAIGDLAAGRDATVTYDVTVGALAAGDHELSSQASASSPNLGTVKSDDPTGSGAQDATVIPVVSTPSLPPSLSAKKRSWVALDADGNDKASPGDTIAYEVTVSNAGPGGATAVVASDTVDANASLEVGSVETPTGGTVELGNAAGDAAVRVRLGSIAAGAAGVFVYRVTIAPALPSGTTTITSPGSVSSNEVGTVKTGGGTVTQVELPDVASPSATLLTPADGSTVTAPTPVTADMAPPAGESIDGWCLYVQLQGGQDRRTVGCDDEAPASRTLGTFDPTVLPNGTYVLTLDVSSSGGGELAVTSTVSVEGALKPGRFTTTYTDMDLPIQTLPIKVTRTYDSFDKEPGDFGTGWKVGFGGFTVATNRPLGLGGWTYQESECRILLGQRLCTSTEFDDLSSHTVTVTWPDGHAETFDFTPKSQVGGVVLGGNAAFTGRRASTSKLRAVADPALTYLGGGDLYESDGSTLYDPQRFELTDKTGTKYVIDAKTGLVSSTDPHGNTLEVTEAGVQSSLGQSITFTRDAAGRITRMDGPSGELRKYAYSPSNDLISVTDSLENTVRYEYDGDHNIIKTIDPLGRPTRIVDYDNNGRMSRITDALGNAVDLDTSSDGRQLTTVSPDDRLTTVVSSDARGNATRVDKIADGKTRTTRYTYDENDNPTGVTDPQGNTTASAYDANSNRISQTDPLGNTTRYDYDGSNWLVKTTSPDGKATTLTRNEQGEVTQTTDPLGHSQTIQYDARGNQTAKIDALGRTTRTTYDGSGAVASVTDPNGVRADYTNDSSGNPMSIAVPGAGTTQVQRDVERRVAAVVDANGGATRYTYDALGQVVGATDPLGHTSARSFDAAGRITSATDREGMVTTSEFNQQGELVREEAGGEVTTFDFDGAGRNVRASNADASTLIDYDVNDRVLRVATTVASETTPAAVSYTYDAAGRRASQTYGGATDTYRYDVNGRIATLTSSSAGSFTFDYDAAGRRSQLARPNSVSTTYGYDAADQLLSIVHAKASSTLDEARYSYDAAGRRSSATHYDGMHAYSYDQAGRITGADHPGTQPDETFVYDLLGNSTNRSEQYDAANRLQSRTGYAYEWDRNGRATRRAPAGSGGDVKFDWSPRGELRTVTPPTGSAVNYKYDAFGRRIATVRNGQTRARVWGIDENIVAEINDGALTRYTFASGYDEPLAMTRAGTSTYFEQDAVNSVTSLTNASGAVTGRYSYDTFGAIRSHTGSDSPFTYTGREYDPVSDLYDYRARWYDAAARRFISEDPIAADNLYRYAENNPISLVDPTGMFADMSEQMSFVTAQGELVKITYNTANVATRVLNSTTKTVRAHTEVAARKAQFGDRVGRVAKPNPHSGPSPSTGPGLLRAGAAFLSAIAVVVNYFAPFVE